MKNNNFDYSTLEESRLIQEIEYFKAIESPIEAEYQLKCRQQFRRFLESDNKLSDLTDKSDLK